jgi:hypothetical protein
MRSPHTQQSLNRLIPQRLNYQDADLVIKSKFMCQIYVEKMLK